MIINSAKIGMESSQSYQATSVTVQGFSVYTSGVSLKQSSMSLRTAVDSQAGNESAEEKKQERTQESGEEKTATLQEWQSRLQAARVNRGIKRGFGQVQTDIRQLSLMYIFKLLFPREGDRFNLKEIKESEQNQGNIHENQQILAQLQSQSTIGMQVLNYTQTTVEVQEQHMDFQTSGKVVTADGREISFNIKVGMSSEFRRTFSEQISLASISMCDPLVINLDRDVADLSDQTFYFDIDGDGEKDEICRLASGSGYLALDKNGDGEIGDGTELFGTATGNGFGDLAKYDEDGNGWIDEADSIWDKLQIWCMNENGKSVLYRLAEKGVGAICLQNTSTNFMLKEVTGRTQGAIRYSGVFLYEDGNVGTVQHVDVAKYEALA